MLEEKYSTTQPSVIRNQSRAFQRMSLLPAHLYLLDKHSTFGPKKKAISG